MECFYFMFHRWQYSHDVLPRRVVRKLMVNIKNRINIDDFDVRNFLTYCVSRKLRRHI